MWWRHFVFVILTSCCSLFSDQRRENLDREVECRISNMILSMAGLGGMGVEEAIDRMRTSLRLLDRVHADKGLSFNIPRKLDLVGKPIIALAIFPERTVVKKGLTVDFEELDFFIASNRDLLKDPHLSVGVWINERESLIEYDIVYAMDASIPGAREKAIQLGKSYNQKAVFDLGERAVIEIKGTTGTATSGLPPILERVRLAAEFLKK